MSSDGGRSAYTDASGIKWQDGGGDGLPGGRKLKQSH